MSDFSSVLLSLGPYNGSSDDAIQCAIEMIKPNCKDVIYDIGLLTFFY
jgi:hypothetical protein